MAAEAEQEAVAEGVEAAELTVPVAVVAAEGQLEQPEQLLVQRQLRVPVAGAAEVEAVRRADKAADKQADEAQERELAVEMPVLQHCRRA
jgi:hypothetical protein